MKKTVGPNDLLSIEEGAKICGLSRTAFCAWTRRHGVEPAHVGNRDYFRVRDLIERQMPVVTRVFRPLCLSDFQDKLDDPTEGGLYVTVEEAAIISEACLDTIRKRGQANAIRTRLDGHRILYNKDDLRQMKLNNEGPQV